MRSENKKLITTVDQFGEQMKLISPKIWMILLAIFLLLLSLCIWSIFGKIETKINTQGISYNNTIYCFLEEEKAAKIQEGMTIKINDEYGDISDVSEEKFSYQQINDLFYNKDIDLPLHLNHRENYYIVKAELPNIQNNVLLNVSIITETINPINFLFD